MTQETSEMELDLLRRRARMCSMYVNRHKHWDPARGTGDLYLQKKRSSAPTRMKTCCASLPPTKFTPRLVRSKNKTSASEYR